jgi:hypothetical protein
VLYSTIDVEIIRTFPLNKRELNVIAKVRHEPTKGSTHFLPANVKECAGKFRYAAVQSIVLLLLSN